MDGAATDLEHGQDVAAHRVAHHQEAVGLDPDVTQDPPVGRRVLLEQDLEVLEVVFESRRGDLARLVHEIALREQQQAMVAPDLGEHLRDVGEQLHGFRQHVVGEVDEPADDLGRHVGARHGDRALHHRQRERLDAVAGRRQVGPLGLAERGREVDARWGERREQLDEPFLGDHEGVLAAPQRVVGIEPDHVEVVRASHRRSTVSVEPQSRPDESAMAEGARPRQRVQISGEWR